MTDTIGALAPSNAASAIAQRPIVNGFIIQGAGSLNGALVFINAKAFIAILSYLVVVGEIKRLELRGAPA